MSSTADALLWQHLTAGMRWLVATQIIAVIVGGLALDSWLGWPGQIAAIGWTFGVFAWLFLLGRTLERRVLILCTAIAGMGEVVLSLVWGIYDYQFGNVPLFVPPGHALLMTLGLLIAAQHPPRAAWWVLAVASLWAAYAWVIDIDRFGVVLFAVYVGCVMWGRSRPLYASMFVIALVMEYYGTALGNWLWLPRTPGLGLSAANPPFSAGALYCLLDLLVLAALAALQRRDARRLTTPANTVCR